MKSVEAPVDEPASFSHVGSAELTGRWWTAFGDEALNEVVDSALESNLSLRTSWQRLVAARAVVDRESSGLLPRLEATGDGDLTRTSGDDGDSETVTLGLSSAYEVDLWGRIRSAVDAERYRAQASLADYQTAAVSLSAEIVRAWYGLAEARNEIALIEQQIATNETVLDLLKTRLGTGLIQSVDLLRQRQLTAATRTEKTRAESRRDVIEHQLAVLLGRAPRQGPEVRSDSLPSLPPLPSTGLPAELLRRRPDVQAAFSRLQAADRDLASAVSSQYPRLTLSASGSSTEGSGSSLFKDWAASVAGGLVAPIFLGGQLRAEVDRSEAVRQQRLLEYGETILLALQEVEDALALESRQVEGIAYLEEQLQLATQAYEQLRVQYFNGASDYLDVLTALDDVQQLERSLLSERLTLLDYRIGLYRALAGPIDLRERTGTAVG